MFKTNILLLFALASISATVLALNPTPVQHIVVFPQGYDSDVKLWHIKNDIIGLYGFSHPDPGYLKFSPESGEIKRILNDTTASCQKNLPFLDRSYFYSAASTLLFYCANNNSLLTINTDSYTVQDAIPVSSSQTFRDVIIGHNEQGLVYILGLPSVINLPATDPSELILVNLTTKAVENHVIFNKDSDSQLLVTGYAFDSGNSYVLTKGFGLTENLIRISKIVIKENDYELTPFSNFTSGKERDLLMTYNSLNIVSGYFFTNDAQSLLIFDQNGNLYLNQTDLLTDPRRHENRGTLNFPSVVARINGSTFYAYFTNHKAFAFSLQNGVMNSTVLDSGLSEMKIVLGETREKDLLMNFGNIKEISTNTTIFSSLREYQELFFSNNYCFAQDWKLLYVFDRQKPGKLLQTLEIPYGSYHDKASNTFMNFADEGSFCRVTYTDLDTFAVSQGPLILSKEACRNELIYVNMTDRANPFFIVKILQKDVYLFVSPAIFGTMETISWTFEHAAITTFSVILPEENGASFNIAWNDDWNSTHKLIRVSSYKVNKLRRRFDLQESYVIAVPMAASEGVYWLKAIDNNKIIMPRSDKKISILDVKLNKTVGTYDVPVFYNQDVFDLNFREIYDKNGKPYVILSEINENVGLQSSTLPQLFDFSKVTPMPEAIENLTSIAVGSGDCSYYVVDTYSGIAVVRLYETCNAAQSQKTLIEY